MLEELQRPAPPALTDNDALFLDVDGCLLEHAPAPLLNLLEMPVHHGPDQVVLGAEVVADGRVVALPGRLADLPAGDGRDAPLREQPLRDLLESRTRLLAVYAQGFT